MTHGAGADAAARITLRWLRCWAAAVADRKGWLTELDASIGDGDHGINLDRGLAALAADLDGAPVPGDAGAILDAAGRRLIGVVGGASGALYGRALGHAGAAVAVDPTPETLPGSVLEAIHDAIAGLGKANPGDKTMLDALGPALEALRAAPPHLAPAVRMRLAADAAEAGAQATIPLIARKGRASYLGDRSAGHLDPGAASSSLLVGCLAAAFEAE